MRGRTTLLWSVLTEVCSYNQGLEQMPLRDRNGKTSRPTVVINMGLHNVRDGVGIPSNELNTMPFKPMKEKAEMREDARYQDAVQ